MYEFEREKEGKEGEIEREGKRGGKRGSKKDKEGLRV